MNPVEQALLSLVNSKCPLPEGLTNGDDIINYLLRTNKITQEQYNNARLQMQSMSQNGQLPTPEMIASYLFRR